jgi:hypothetical protein
MIARFFFHSIYLIIYFRLLSIIINIFCSNLIQERLLLEENKRLCKQVSLFNYETLTQVSVTRHALCPIESISVTYLISR